MAPSRRLAALAAITALALTACASNDAKASDVVSAMEDTGLTEEQADCIGDGIFDEGFTQEQLNDLGSADNVDDFPAETRDPVTSIVDECTGSSEGSEAGDEGGESTTTTTAEG
jgi:hypothetical protein